VPRVRGVLLPDLECARFLQNDSTVRGDDIDVKHYLGHSASEQARIVEFVTDHNARRDLSDRVH
jgi:hypothetical protein